MSEDIIDFYRKANVEKMSDTPVSVAKEENVIEPILESVEEPLKTEIEDTSLNSFLSILSDSIQKEKEKRTAIQVQEKVIKVPVVVTAIEPQGIQEPIANETSVIIEGDPLDSFLDKFQNIVKTNKEKKVKATTLEFINNLKNGITKVEEESKEEPVVLDDNKEEIAHEPITTVSEEIADQEQAPVEKETSEAKPGKKYVGELKALDKKVKKIEKPVTKPNDIKTLISQQVETQTAKITDEVKAYARRILDLGGGGGSVAQQFANGGTMKGDLNVTGKYLSAGVELSTLFSTGGGGGGTTDRLVAGGETLILNSDGTVSLPNNTLRSPNDLELILESENTTLSAFTQIALTPHGFLAYDSAGDSITFDSISNTIVFKTIDEYTWTLDDQGNITGPDGTLTVSGNVDTTGNILSGGKNLDQIFITHETDSQTLSYTPSSYRLSISNGNTVSLSSLSSTPTDLSFLSVSGNWNSTFNTVSSLSGNWNTAYNTATVYANNSASYATTSFVNNNFLSLTGGTVTGRTDFNGNVTVYGNLTATGTTTFANTIFTVTSALSVVHIGAGPALYVGNNGTGDIASFYDIDQNVEVLHIGGINSSYPNVGIKTSSPNKTFTVVGEISATSDITTSGKIYSQGNGSSDQWNSVYSYVRSTSATNNPTYNATNFSKLSSQAYTLTNSTTASIVPRYGNNSATKCFASVAGGCCNTASGYFSHIGGGSENITSNDYNFVGGGYYNNASGGLAVIAGGQGNQSSGYVSFVGAGYSNIASGNLSVVGGGASNTASGVYPVIAGGQSNTISGFYDPSICGYRGISNSIVGGSNNCIVNNNYNAIGGGLSNCIINVVTETNCSNIAGGFYNTVTAHAANIAGGSSNTASGYYSNIAGGRSNTVFGENSNIAGGLCNIICNSNVDTSYSSVVGGTCNSVKRFYSSVLGGCKNNNNSTYSSIVGGRNNSLSGTNNFILGSNISVSANNYTFVNNLSSQGTIAATNISIIQTPTTFINPVTASGTFLIVNVNGTNQAIQLWNYSS